MKLFNSSKPKVAGSVPHWKEVARHISKDAFIDWALIFAFNSVLALALIVIGTLCYFNVEKVLTDPPNSGIANSIPGIDSNLLGRVITQFENRAADRAELLKKPVIIEDPSI